jgi:polyhydroxyalkanoate synthesis regulator phasin
MVLDGLRGYLQLANGLTDVTRERARSAAKALQAQSEVGVGAVVPPQLRNQVGALTDDLLATSRTNRDLLVNLVRAEIERSVARLGLVSAQELAAATRRARGLERRVEELEQELSSAKRAATKAPAKKSTARKSTARKSPARKSTAKTSAAKTSTAGSSTAESSTAESSTAESSTPRKSTEA